MTTAQPPESAQDRHRPTCGTCRHWKLDREASSDLSFGECRALPPTMRATTSGTWPGTRRSEWCGHHQPPIPDAPEDPDGFDGVF